MLKREREEGEEMSGHPSQPSLGNVSDHHLDSQSDRRLWHTIVGKLMNSLKPFICLNHIIAIGGTISLLLTTRREFHLHL